MRLSHLLHWATIVLATNLAACKSDRAVDSAADALTNEESDFLDDVQERAFRFFWETTDSVTGLAPDRFPTKSFASVAATGFALTAYPIGVEAGYVSREAAAQRVRDTLRFLWQAEQSDRPTGATGFHGFFYHFLDSQTGARFGTVELSTVDTALLLSGAFFCQSYFDRDHPLEREIVALTDSLYFRVDWPWASVRPPTIGHGWTAENGFLPYDWRGYNEAMLVYLYALGSPTHPVASEAWNAWTGAYQWGGDPGREHFGFAPLFGHQYSQTWIDFRGIQDEMSRARGIDYWENSRRAALTQYAYALENPQGFAGYGPDLWGWTACDGPVNGSFEIGGRSRTFHTYWARGVSFLGIDDDGTVAPTAAGSSIAFTPELSLATMMSMKANFGANLYGRYGFLDALNPTFTIDVPVQHGKVVPGVGWFDTDYLGIDQGPLLAMIANYRTGLVWRVMRANRHVRRSLEAAGFEGGWLEE